MGMLTTTSDGIAEETKWRLQYVVDCLLFCETQFQELQLFQVSEKLNEALELSTIAAEKMDEPNEKTERFQ